MYRRNSLINFSLLLLCLPILYWGINSSSAQTVLCRIRAPRSHSLGIFSYPTAEQPPIELGRLPANQIADIVEIRDVNGIDLFYLRTTYGQVTGWLALVNYHIMEFQYQSDCEPFLHSARASFVPPTSRPTLIPLPTTEPRMATATAQAIERTERELMGPWASSNIEMTWSEAAEYCLNTEIQQYLGLPGCWTDDTHERFHPPPLAVFLFGPGDNPLRGVASSASATCVSTGVYGDVLTECSGFGRTLYFRPTGIRPGLPYFELITAP